jgi:hypothetical protein
MSCQKHSGSDVGMKGSSTDHIAHGYQGRSAKVPSLGDDPPGPYPGIPRPDACRINTDQNLTYARRWARHILKQDYLRASRRKIQSQSVKAD